MNLYVEFGRGRPRTLFMKRIIAKTITYKQLDCDGWIGMKVHRNHWTDLRVENTKIILWLSISVIYIFFGWFNDNYTVLFKSIIINAYN